MKMAVAFSFSDEHTHYQRANIIWELTARGFYRISLFFAAIGLFLCGLGQITPYSFSATVNNGVTYYNYHITIGLGIGFVLVALYYLLLIRKLKKQTQALFQSFLQKARRSNDLTFSYVIEEGYMEFTNVESYLRYNWIRFSNYRVYKGYLCLYESKLSQPTVLFSLDSLSKEEQQWVITTLTKASLQKLS